VYDKLLKPRQSFWITLYNIISRAYNVQIFLIWYLMCYRTYILAHNLQTEFKEEFHKEYAAGDHAAPIKIHQIIEEP